MLAGHGAGLEQALVGLLQELRLAGAKNPGIPPLGVVRQRKAPIKLAQNLRLRRIHVRDRHVLDVAAVDVNRAPIGETGNDQASQARERRSVIERRGQKLAGFGKKRKLCLLRIDLLVAIRGVRGRSFRNANVQALRENVELVDVDPSAGLLRGPQDAMP